MKRGCCTSKSKWTKSAPSSHAPNMHKSPPTPGSSRRPGGAPDNSPAIQRWVRFPHTFLSLSSPQGRRGPGRGGPSLLGPLQLHRIWINPPKGVSCNEPHVLVTVCQKLLKSRHGEHGICSHPTN